MCSFVEPAAPERRNAEPLTAVVAQRVRTLRERSGMSQTQLAERMTELGKPWNRAAVMNLERRAATTRDNKKRGTVAGRDAVTLQEWLTLARALRTPPLWLLADPASPDPVPLAEGTALAPWELLMWISGDQHPDNPDLAFSAEGSQAAEQLQMFREVSRELASYRRSCSLVMNDEQREDFETRALSSLRFTLERLVVLRVPLPPLPADVTKRARELGVELPGLED